MKDAWRENIDPFLRSHLESQLKQTMKYREDYKHSRDPSRAQLWIAIANLSRQLFNVTVKLNYMERLLQEKFEADSNKKVVEKPKSKRKVRKVKKTVKRRKKR